MIIAGGQAVVTGASSGIGRAIAIALARRGMRVLFVGRDVERLQKASQEAGGNASPLAADITTDAGRSAIADRIQNELHVLVHSAGIYGAANVATMRSDMWAELDAVNLHAPMLLTGLCLPPLRSVSGQVIFINSSAALSVSPGLSAYSASKRGLQAAADALRQEVNPDGIRVLSIFPGRTDTPMQAAILANEGRSAPSGALMLPEDIAAIVVAALDLPRTSEVTDIIMRPMRKL